MNEDAEKIAKEAVKKDLKKLLKGVDEMTVNEVRDRLAEIIWGMGYNEGYFIGHYEGKSGRSYAQKEGGS